VVLLTAIVVASATGFDADSSLDAVVMLLQGDAVCAGAFVDQRGTVATAYHCVASGGAVHVLTRDGRAVRGRVRSVDVVADVALVDAPGLAGEPHLQVREGDLTVGETAWVLGHPFGMAPVGFLEGTLAWSVSMGVVSALGPLALQTSAPVNPGNSGGPVVDAEGRVIGIVSRRLQGDGLGFAGRSSRIARLLRGDGRRPGVGGTLGLQVFGQSFEGDGGTAAVGGQAEIALRDSVIFTIGGGLAPTARWEAERLGAVRWSAFEAHGGLRKRLGSGPLTTRVDIWAGAAAIATRSETAIGWQATTYDGAGLLGATATLGTVGADVGYLPASNEWRLQLLLRWPGVMTVF